MYCVVREPLIIINIFIGNLIQALDTSFAVDISDMIIISSYKLQVHVSGIKYTIMNTSMSKV